MTTPRFIQPIGTPTVWDLAGRAQPEVSSIDAGSIYFDTASGKFKVSENGGVYVNLVGGGGGGTLQTDYDNGGAGGGLITLSPLGGPFSIAQPTTNSTAVVIQGDASAGPGVQLVSNSFTRSGGLSPNTAAIAYQAGITTHAGDAAGSAVIGYLANSDKSPGGSSATVGFGVVGEADLFGIAVGSQMGFLTVVFAPGPTTGEIFFTAANGTGGGGDPGHGITFNTGSASGGPANGGDVTVNLGAGAAGGVDGQFVVKDSTGVPFVTFDGSTHKITFTGAIDPTSVLLSGGTALFFESNDGATAPLSGAATGRIRYNDATGNWESSTHAAAYSAFLTAGTGTLATVLLAGNVTGARDVLVTLGQQIDTAAAGQLSLGVTNATSFALGSTTGTQQVFINQGGVALHGSNAGVQLSSITANRAQYRANQYGANAGVPGISTFKSRGATVGSLAGVIDGDVIFRDTAVGVCPDNVSVPLSGLISIFVPPGGSVAPNNWIATEFQVQLVPLEGPINGRKEMFRVTSQGVLCVRETLNRMAGTATLDAAGTVTIANTSVKATTKFNLTVQDGGPAPTGVVYQSARVVNTSFTITSSAGAADAGVVVYYQLWEPATP